MFYLQSLSYPFFKSIELPEKNAEISIQLHSNPLIHPLNPSFPLVQQVKLQREQFAAADAEAKEKTKKAEVRSRSHGISWVFCWILCFFHGIFMGVSWDFMSVLMGFCIGVEGTSWAFNGVLMQLIFLFDGFVDYSR